VDDAALRQHVIRMLRGQGAHLATENMLAEFPARFRGATLPGIPNTPWRLLEHLRIAQWDILEFSRDPAHLSPVFPDGYWPNTSTPPTEDAWPESVERFLADLQAMEDLVASPATDLFSPIPHGDGQTVLREALLVADHNAYHLGQLMLMRRILEETGT